MTYVLEVVCYREPRAHSNDDDAAAAHSKAFAAMLEAYGWTVTTRSINGAQVTE